MHKSRRISLSPCFSSFQVQRSSVRDVRHGGTFQTFYWFLCCCCFHGELVPAVIAPRPPRSWAEGEMGTVWAGTITPVCFLFQTVSHFVVLLLLSRPCCSLLIWLLLFFYCFALLWFLDLIFLYLPFPSPAAQRSWPAKKTKNQKHLLMSTFGEILKKRGVWSILLFGCAHIHRSVLQDVWNHLPADCKCS